MFYINSHSFILFPFSSVLTHYHSNHIILLCFVLPFFSFFPFFILNFLFFFSFHFILSHDVFDGFTSSITIIPISSIFLIPITLYLLPRQSKSSLNPFFLLIIRCNVFMYVSFKLKI